MKHYPLTPQIAWMLQELARKADQRAEDYLRDLIMNFFRIHFFLLKQFDQIHELRHLRCLIELY